ncbi:MAG: aldo/keto reductase [Burkholderiales bacterium]|nr:aldo/keto reductase [Burkholderiales bacterium]
MVPLADGSQWPALGLGTWRYGETAGHRAAEVRALRLALECGYRLIDTAEMYGEGGAEAVIGEALAGAMADRVVRRDDILVVSKVYPHNAGRTAMRKACEASLKRLGLHRLDLYLLHWPGNVPLAETVAAFEDLIQRGHIARWGVSNFDTGDLLELAALPGGSACAANQVYLSLRERGPEFDLLPWQQDRSMPLMAYSPIDQGALAGHEALARVARRHAATPVQVALSALLMLPGVIVIPKSSNPARLRENWGAGALRLTAEDRADLDGAFPPPSRKRPLAML